MQILATIMRLVVILSVLVQIYANTGSAPWTRHGLLVAGPNPAGRAIVTRPTGEERTSGGQVDGRTGGGSRPERNVYRTKLSKLRLVLLADMLNEIPPPQLELITCLANSSTLNVTTKHCDCETYSCKDLLASSSPSPLNYIQPKRKIHTSCREHCCRKKKFNRSIDPATLENVVASSLSTASRRYNTVAGPSMVHRSPMGSLSLSTSTISKGMQPSETSSFRLRTTGSPSPAIVRDHRDRLATACNSDGLDQISIANNRVRAPWLYRVGLIETKHPVCVGALIHPSLILTTAVCVINKKPEELVVWRGTVDGGADERWAVGRIMLPEKFATTFERLENNVALLLLVPTPVHTPAQSSPTEAPRPIRSSSTTGGLRAWTVSVRSGGAPIGPNHARTQLFPAHQHRRTPTSICLSSIIERTAAYTVPELPESFCYTVSLRQTHASTAAPQPATGSSGANSFTLRNDGTNYVTTNVSIFPGTECRPEHREYLQHDGNLCAGYGAAKNRSIDVDYSGSPLICDKLQTDGKIYRTVQGLLTWSTDINHAPHLFTNLTTYRQWIDREIEKLDGATQTQRLPTVPRPIVVQTASNYPDRAVLYG
uniref:Peptidase S1 domain-containing protein n=1 Tax=Anopheles funestus TaxID=62324 RepID=A0A4Y0BFE3_ANOFN